MKKKYFHNEIILNRGDELSELCVVDSGKAVVMDPLDSKILRVLHAGDTVGIDHAIRKQKIPHLTVAQGESMISRVELLEYINALSNASDAAKKLVNQLLRD
jgi:signal-transduction protein with cAMP-binding, CBS, and nucleotidyltransferase domain